MAKKTIASTIDEFLKDTGSQSASSLEDVKRIPTGLLTVDHILDGGMPLGRFVELYGPPGSGKSTLALSTIKMASRLYPENRGLYLDLEGGLSASRITDMGVVPGWLINKAHAENGEEWLNVLEKAIKSNLFMLIVLDSVAGISPKSWSDGEIGGKHALGGRAALLSESLERLHTQAVKHNVGVIWINQVRENFSSIGFGPKKAETTGGKALKHYVDIRLMVRSIGKLKDSNDRQYGHYARVGIEKNRLGEDKQVAEFEILYDAPGADCRKKVLELACLYKIINKKGSWFAFEDQQLGQGENKTIDYLDEHPELSTIIITKVKQVLDEAKQERREKARKKLETEWKTGE